MRTPFELDPHSMKASLRFDQLRLSTLPTFHRQEHFRGTATKTIDSRRHIDTSVRRPGIAAYIHAISMRVHAFGSPSFTGNGRGCAVFRSIYAPTFREHGEASMIVDARAGSSGIRSSVNPRPRTVAPTWMTVPPRFSCTNARAIGHWYDAACAILSVLCAQSAVREQRLTARGIIVTAN